VVLENDLPFFLQLRHKALKRAYHPITAQEISYSMLCRAFRYCIFSSTREDIIRRLHFLLHESAKTNITLLTINNPTTIFDEGELEDITHMTPILRAIQSPHFNLPATQSTPGGRAEFKATFRESTEEYIDPEGVEKYLSERGLTIEPGSDIVPFPVGGRTQHRPTPTLFDEIRRSQELKLSVNKLLTDKVVLSLNMEVLLTILKSY